ncbi:MAG TPA: hypothetical protein DCQ93_07870 [Bacteroidetes bacterium]|nr:hypothetical protein [Bacteroidota bacterium]
MKKDIEFEKVEDLAVAIIPEKEGTLPDEEWFVYLVNLKNEPIEGVIIASTGYGDLEGKQVKTSTLRQFFERVSPQQFVKVELIEQKLFALNNEFWVSFWQNGKMFDRKYVFVTDSISETNFTQIPLVNKRGVMIL